MSAPVLFVSDSATPPGFAVLVAQKSVVVGLKVLMKLEVKDAELTVTLLVYSERPGTWKGPRLTQKPSPGTEQSAPVLQALRVRQAEPRIL